MSEDRTNRAGASDDSGPTPGGLDDRILPWSQVKVISGLSRTTVWRLQKTGDFPAAVQVSPNRVGWRQSELLEWKRARLPRRLPEPRVLPKPSPAPPPPPSLARGEPLLTHRTPGARSRRRGPVTPPEQGAFDF